MNIKKKDHLESLIGSLNKMFLNAKNKAYIRNKELSLLNIVYKLLKQNCFNDNIDKDKRQLLSIYYKLLNKYSFLCKANLTKEYIYENNKINPTSITCNDYTASEPIKVFYWQEEDYETTLEEIIDKTNNEFLQTKLFDSLSIFNLGKNIIYNNIGKICFAITNPTNENYIISDSIGNNITSQFDITLLEEEHITLIVSKNIYSFGDITIKINT